jgi:hypothetical protein
VKLSRIAQNTDAKITVAVYDSEGDPVTGQPVTLGVTRADGSELIAADTDANEDGDGLYSYTLDAATHTDAIDRLAARWVVGSGQVLTTYHDVVGSHFFELADLRRLEPLDDTDIYPARLLAEYRDLASYAIEDACAVAFTPRYGEYLFDGDNSRSVNLQVAGVREILSATLDGEAIDVAELDLRGGMIRRRAGSYWTREKPGVIRYSHAISDVAPLRVARATKLLAREMLFADAGEGDGSAVPDRATSLSSEAGTFSLVTAGIGDALFEIPEVNAVVQEYSAQGPVFVV